MVNDLRDISLGESRGGRRTPGAFAVAGQTLPSKLPVAGIAPEVTSFRDS